MDELRVRHDYRPHRKCGHGMDKQRVFPWEYPCDRYSDFSLDSPGELAASVCVFHVGKASEVWANAVKAAALRNYDESTTRLRALGKPCRICGVRRENHLTSLNNGSARHAWTDDEDTAEIWERDRK